MQKQQNLKNNINDSDLLNDLNNSKYLDEVCKLLPTLLIKTQFGIGRYQFNKLAYQDDDLVLLFKLSKDNKKLIHDEIEYHFGDQFIISASQYLYAYEYNAFA